MIFLLFISKLYRKVGFDACLFGKGLQLLAIKLVHFQKFEFFGCRPAILTTKIS